MQSFTPTGRTVTRTFVPPKMAIVWVERGTAHFFFIFFYNFGWKSNDAQFNNFAKCSPEGGISLKVLFQ